MPLRVAGGGCCSQRSGGSAEVLGEHLGGCPPPERFAWSTVQRRRDGCELLGAVPREVGASGEILAQRGCPGVRRTEMDALVKGWWLVGVVGHGGGCAGGRATVAAATTTVTLRCAGRDRRTVSGRELPRTLIASRDRIVLIEVPPAGRGGRLAPSVESLGQAACSWRTGWLVVAAQRKPVSSRATATVAMVGRLPCEVRCL